MRKRRQIELFSISFLDLLSGALGAVIILYVAIPKNTARESVMKADVVTEVMKKDLSDSRATIAELQRKLSEMQTAVVTAPATPATERPVTPEGDMNADVGFKFKGKNIVFVIDTSYSMTEEDRMSQVKAGLKMLLTSLSAAFRIEIVQFPLGERAPFRSMWGTTKDFQGINRMDAFDFIYALNPSGGTPTRDTLLFVLKNYESLSDIVLLTDGVPTYHNSNQKDDIYEILRQVRESNPTKVQISTIGVGSNFLKDKSSEQFKFLSLLSQEHNGFFVGF